MATKDANDTVLEVSPLILRGMEPYTAYRGTTQMRTVKVSYMWTIKDYNSLISEEVKEVFTKYFWTRDTIHIRWKMGLKIASIDEENVQLELHYMNDELFVPYPMFLKAQISILNAKSERKHTAISFEGVLKENGKKEASVSKHLLIENSDLSRNSLTFYCEILQSGYFNIHTDTNVSLSENPLSDISRPFENSFSTDTVIDVQGTVFKVHRAVLAAQFPVFRAMFKLDMKMMDKVENVVKIEGIHPTIFREVLRYIYTNKVKITDSIVCELMIAADKYGVEGLKIICEKTLYDIIKVNNAMHILVVANELKITPLKQKVLKFIKSNLADVIKSDGWNEVLDSHMILAKDILKMHISD